MNSPLPPAVLEAIELLSDLPGVGSRSAERLVHQVLRQPQTLGQKLERIFAKLHRDIRACTECGNWSEETLCPLCQDASRDETQVCVIETPLDILAIERTGEWKGRYQVLGGLLSPMQKVGPSDLRIEEMRQWVVKNPQLREMVVALPPNTEGDTTTHFLCQNLTVPAHCTLTRPARGLPQGSSLDFIDLGTLSRAFSQRHTMSS